MCSLNSKGGGVKTVAGVPTIVESYFSLSRCKNSLFLEVEWSIRISGG